MEGVLTIGVTSRAWSPSFLRKSDRKIRHDTANYCDRNFLPLSSANESQIKFNGDKLLHNIAKRKTILNITVINLYRNESWLVL